MPHRFGDLYENGYRYGFQDQEKDNEIKGNGNSLNYTFRMHDPRVGRFFATDPLTSKYPWNSPYAFSENRVIDGVELEGLEYAPTKTPGAGTSSGSSEYTDKNGFPNGTPKPPIELPEVTIQRPPSLINECLKSTLNAVANALSGIGGAMTGASSISPELNAAYNADYAPATDGKSVAITYGIVLAPITAVAAVELGTVGAITTGYESYCTWYAGTATSNYIASATFASVGADLFTVNSLGSASVGFLTTSGGQYIASGFNVDKITVKKNIITAPLGGFGGLVFKSSFQQDNGGFRFSNLNEFALDFSFGRVSEQFGSKIKLLSLPKFSQGMGTYSESVLIMGAKAGVNTVKNEVKDEIKSEEDCEDGN